jgi:hypothetical protein
MAGVLSIVAEQEVEGAVKKSDEPGLVSMRLRPRGTPRNADASFGPRLRENSPNSSKKVPSSVVSTN